MHSNSVPFASNGEPLLENHFIIQAEKESQKATRCTCRIFCCTLLFAVLSVVLVSLVFGFIFITSVSDDNFIEAVGIARNVTCIDDRPYGLCTVDMSTFPFAPVNYDIPANTRGVVFVVASDDNPGWTNPSIDLNRLTPYPKGHRLEGKYWVDSASPQYQTWEDNKDSYSVFHEQKIGEYIGARNDITPSDDGPIVTLSIFNGRFTIPGFSSPTETIGPNLYTRKLVLFGKTVSTWPGYRIIDADGQKTVYFEKMLNHTKDQIAVTRPY